MTISITIILIVITCVVSFAAFNSDKLFDELIFYPPAVAHQNQVYRFFTCGFIHANYAHLFFNMYSLYVFGKIVEPEFANVFGPQGKWLYLLMYLSSLYACLLPTYSKNKDNYNYRSLGASGAVSAVVFAFIFLEPLAGLGPIGLSDRLNIPGVIFGVIYLVVSSYMDRKGGGNINHSAHIWGALYGIGFLIVTGYFLSRYNLLQSFLRQVQSLF